MSREREQTASGSGALRLGFSARWKRSSAVIAWIAGVGIAIAAPACGARETSDDGLRGDDGEVAEAKQGVVTATCINIERTSGGANDTYVHEGSPNTNFGSAASLSIGSASQALIKFNLSSIPPNALLTKAQLRVRTEAGGAGTVNVHAILKTWAEFTASYGSFYGAPVPAFSPAIEGSFAVLPLGFKNVEVLPVVQAWYDGSKANHGFLLKGSTFLTLYSSEAVGSRPTLRVCYFVDEDGDGYTADVDCDDHDPSVNPGAAEVCDGVDDDCDGLVDEGNPGGGQACTTGKLGVCAAGTSACVSGGIICNGNAQQSAESCDGLDNDCDGLVDEGNPGGGQTCTTGKPGACSPGTTVCTDGQLACLQDAQPSAELCDGLDNDCDGLADEGNPGGGRACITGNLGACAAGTMVCTGGQIACSQNAPPSAEICDGIDNDCDGLVDDNLAPCAPLDGCHVAGACTNGVCTNPPAVDGSACDDGNTCTQTDTCQGGVCTGSNLVVCGAPNTFVWTPGYVDADQLIFPGQFNDAIQNIPPQFDVTGLAFDPFSMGFAHSHQDFVTFTIYLGELASNTWFEVYSATADYGSEVSLAGVSVSFQAIPVVTDIWITSAPYQHFSYHLGDAELLTLTSSTPGSCQEVCDGIDNDCNGLIDDNAACGVGGCPGASCAAAQTSACLAIQDNTAAPAFGLRVAHLPISAPAAFTHGILANVVQGGVAPNQPSCSIFGEATFNWLLSFDAVAGKLETGGARPVSPMSQGYSFLDEDVPVLGGSMHLGRLVLDAPLGSDGGFNSSAGDINIPIYLDQAGHEPILLPLRHLSFVNGKVSPDHSCIGSYNAGGLDPANSCIGDDQHPTFLTDAQVTAYIDLEEADTVYVTQLNESLCVLLSGAPAQYGDGGNPPRCKRSNGVIVYQGDWCKATNQPATAGCSDALRFSSTFAASGIKIN